MSNLTRQVKALLIVIAILFGGIVYLIPDPDPVYQNEVQRIKEDDPRWDCRTMGNKRCGPESKARPGGGFW